MSTDLSIVKAWLAFSFCVGCEYGGLVISIASYCKSFEILAKYTQSSVLKDPTPATNGILFFAVFFANFNISTLSDKDWA